jgi:SAM-dependent methyltransferase
VTGVELDETAFAGPEHLDPAYVAVLQSHGLDDDSTVIDFGAGTGTFALAVAPHCRRVIAVDVSPAMVAALRAKAASTGTVKIAPVQAGFLSYAHDGDLWKVIAIRRMAGLLVTGGILRLRDLVFSYPAAGAEASIERWIDATAVDRPDVG